MTISIAVQETREDIYFGRQELFTDSKNFFKLLVELKLTAEVEDGRGLRVGNGTAGPPQTWLLGPHHKMVSSSTPLTSGYRQRCNFGNGNILFKPLGGFWASEDTPRHVRLHHAEDPLGLQAPRRRRTTTP